MRFEFPECRRCCLCVPLRIGIIIFAYLNLLFAFLVLFFQIMYLVERGRGVEGMKLYSLYVYKGAAVYTQVWLPTLLYTLEVVFNIVLLVGAHTGVHCLPLFVLIKGQVRSILNRRERMKRLMKVDEAKLVCQDRVMQKSIVSAYPYGIQACFYKRVKLIRAYYYYGITTTVAAIMTFFVVRYETKLHDFDLLEFSLAACGIILHLYLLLLIRSELSKRRYQEGRMSFVNHITEVTFHPPPRRQAERLRAVNGV